MAELSILPASRKFHIHYVFQFELVDSFATTQLLMYVTGIEKLRGCQSLHHCTPPLSAGTNTREISNSLIAEHAYYITRHLISHNISHNSFHYPRLLSRYIPPSVESSAQSRQLANYVGRRPGTATAQHDDSLVPEAVHIASPSTWLLSHHGRCGQEPA